MKNNAVRTYKAPQIEMIILNSQDVIANSWLAFFGEDDMLAKEEIIDIEEEVISYNGYNVLCD